MKRFRDNAPHTRRTAVPIRIAVFTLLCWLLPLQAFTEPSSQGLSHSSEGPSPLDGTAPERALPNDLEVLATLTNVYRDRYHLCPGVVSDPWDRD